MEPRSRKTGKKEGKTKLGPQSTRPKTGKKEDSVKYVSQKVKQNNIPVKIVEVPEANVKQADSSSIQDPIQPSMLNNIQFSHILKIDGLKLRYETDAALDDWVKHMEWTINLNTKRKQWKDIKVLKISPTNGRWVKRTDSTLDCFKMLARMISRNFPQLQKLDLDLRRWLRLDDQALEILAMELWPKLVHLKSIQIRFSEWATITSKGIEVLAKEICRFLPNLTSLSLSFGPGSECLNDKGLKVMSAKIARYLHNLKSFNLVVGNQAITPGGIETFTSNISKRAAKLEHLKVMSNLTIPEASLKSLTNIFCKNLMNLRSLKFALELPRIKQRVIWNSLSQITQHLTNLEHLYFNFSSPDANVITQENENEIGFISPLTSLKTLELRLGESLTSTASLLLWSSKINQCFPNLENLGLTIEYHHSCQQSKSCTCSNEITYKRLEGLIFDMTCSLPSLKALHIDFSGARDIARQCPKDFKSDIPRPRLNLKQLYLDFRSCSKTADDFWEALAVRIVFFFPGLEDLCIGMPEKKYEEGVLRSFAILIGKRLPKLKRFVYEYASSNAKNAEDMRNLVRYVPNLHVVVKTK